MTAITITTVGHNLIRDALQNANTSFIKYVALGSGTTTPQITDTQLANEIFRKLATSYTNGGTGEILINLYVSPNDLVNQNIEEVGFFGGATATSKGNSGVLLARGLFTHNPKTNLESIQFQLDFTV